LYRNPCTEVKPMFRCVFSQRGLDAASPLPSPALPLRYTLRPKEPDTGADTRTSRQLAERASVAPVRRREGSGQWATTAQKRQRPHEHDMAGELPSTSKTTGISVILGPPLLSWNADTRRVSRLLPEYRAVARCLARLLDFAPRRAARHVWSRPSGVLGVRGAHREDGRRSWAGFGSDQMSAGRGIIPSSAPARYVLECRPMRALARIPAVFVEAW